MFTWRACGNWTPWPPFPTLINIQVPTHYLASLGTRVCWVCQPGLTYRFHTGYTACFPSAQPAAHQNHPSSLANSHVKSEYLHQEVATGRMVGPLPTHTRCQVHCSPIGVVPKGRNSDRWRTYMIVDLSHPANRNVNDGICKQLCTLTYPSIADAVQFIRLLGPGTLLLKVHLKSVHTIPLYQSMHLTAISLEYTGRVGCMSTKPYHLASAPLPSYSQQSQMLLAGHLWRPVSFSSCTTWMIFFPTCTIWQGQGHSCSHTSWTR